MAERQQARLEFGEAGRLQPARGAQLLDDGLERVEPPGSTSTSTRRNCMGRWPLPDDDDGLVERDLSGVDAADAQREGTAPGAHLQHLAQPVRADDGAQAPAHRALRSEPVGPGRREHLGHLEALAQPAALGRARVLQGDLVLAAAPTGAQDEAGAGDTPVVGVEVGVGQTPRRAGQRGDGAAVVGLDGEGGQGGQPALHGAQVERVELPLDLDGVARAARVAGSFPGTRTSEPG